MALLRSTSIACWSLLFASLSCMIFGSESARTFGNQTDRSALLNFKDRLNDPLGSLSSWNDTLHFCQWRGVTCGRRHHQRITVLNLEQQSLVGPLSPSLGNLSFLRVLNLGNNKFSSEIPQELGHLFRLRRLNLSWNSLAGRIPASLSRCIDLTVIDLDKNMLIGGVPIEVGSLSKLETLQLSGNNLTGRIPAFLGNLSSLVRLGIAMNNFDGNIPNELGMLANLQTAYLGANNLSGMLPTSIWNISTIEKFSVSANYLHGILSEEIGIHFPNLQILYVGGNQFTGPIPVSISNASQLIHIDLPENKFSGPVRVDFRAVSHLEILSLEINQLGTGKVNDLSFLDSLTNCTSLRVLALDENDFAGELPKSMANLSTGLRELYIGGNQIYGSILAGMENLIGLQLLDLQDNLFTGNIHEGIGKLKNLLTLSLAGNKLSGPIPSSLGNISQLFELKLIQNYLQGTIPSTLGNLGKLEVLDISQNNFSGTINKRVMNITMLHSLKLAQNSFHGPLPLEVGNLNSLVELDVSSNKLIGDIPIELGNCLALRYLHMERNSFQGKIPPSFRNLQGIQDLDLSHNNLSGAIPEFLGNFTSLKNLKLSFNDMEGEVPTEGVFGNASAISLYGNRKLCGGIQNLRLPTCHFPNSSNHGRSISPKLIIPVSVVVPCILVAACIVVAFMRQSRKKTSSSSSSDDQFVKVSFADLFKATDGFSLANLIGSGSYSSVYSGFLDCYKKVVAIKVLNLQQQQASKSFIAECKALRRIRHRNLAKILTCCSSLDFKGDNFKALVFEFLSNGSLEKWLHPQVNTGQRLGTLNFIQRLNIAVDVAAALDYLHHRCQQPVVHCDVKPSNVLLDDDMSAHVGDFGLARLLSAPASTSSANQTSSLAVKGTVGYIAPEYGVGSELSTQGDVYSYGILLLEIFTGKRPTDDMFKDNLSLHAFAKMALPHRVMEIVDPSLLLNEDDQAINIDPIRKKDCLAMIMNIGVSCSSESPRERMQMKDVVVEMHQVRDFLLGIRAGTPHIAQRLGEGTSGSNY